MDHLVSFGRSERIHVPYVCQHPFSGSIFDYPERRGWDREALINGDFQGHTLQETTAFLQEWLFFGPLHHIFDSAGVDFDVAHFKWIDQDGRAYVTTDKLPMYVTKWFSTTGNQLYAYRVFRPEDQRRADFQHIYPALKEIHPFVLRYCGMHSNSGRNFPKLPIWPLTPELSLSIMVLCDSLTKMAFEGTNLKYNFSWGESRLLYDRMLAAGWCPHTLSRLTTTQAVGIMYTAESLGAPSPRSDHSECSSWSCKLDQIDEKTYETRHVVEGCKCQAVGPSVDEVVRCLEEGAIPLVQFFDDGQSIEVKVSRHVPNVADADYTALSHIWSEGLGNPHENELPECQLRRLQGMANAFNQREGTNGTVPAHWWCDTLCVPVGSDLKEHRKLAIRRMAATYADAKKVLVLDNTLLQVSIQSPMLEIYLRVRLSGWMRRLWTLQEGVLGKCIAFKLGDDTIDLGRIDREMMQTEVATRRTLYSRYSFLSHSELGMFLRQWVNPVTNQPVPQHLRLDNLWKHLQWRSTSKQADETVCIASMLGISEAKLAELLQFGDTDFKGRMICLLRSLDAINLKLLFQPPPRLDEVGFRWAPTSLLTVFRGAETMPERALSGTAQLGPGGRGLLLNSAGLVVLAEGNALGLPAIGTDFFILPRHPDAEPLRLNYVQAKGEPVSDRNATNLDGSRRLTRPAMILGQALYSSGTVDCVLVDVINWRDGMATCHFIAWVGLKRASQSGLPSGGMVTVRADVLDGAQRWLVL